MVDRDVLVRWSTKSSGRCARVARSRIANMQKAVVRLIHESAAVDLFGVAETTDDFLDFLEAKDVEIAERSRCVGLLEKLALLSENTSLGA